MWYFELWPGFSFFELLYLIIIVMIIFFIAKTIIIYLRRELKDDLKPSQLRIVLKLVNVAGVIIALFIILPILGVDETGILVAGGIIGLVLAFAAQNVISNFISGIFLFLERPFQIGDSVEIDKKEGTVEDVRLFSATIRGYDGYIFRIPNEKVFANTIINYSLTPARRFEYTIGIRYKDDSDKALEIIRNLSEEHPYILKNPGIQNYVDELGDNSVNIVVRMWSPSSEWYDVKMNFLQDIRKALEAAGIEIPFPQRTVWLEKSVV
jgi:small-conductance mechanosensitive channel